MVLLLMLVGSIVVEAPPDTTGRCCSSVHVVIAFSIKIAADTSK